jgi:hypothetical protein
MGEWMYSLNILDLGETELSGQLQAKAILSQGKDPHRTLCTRGWVGLSTGLDAVEKKKSLVPAGNQIQTFPTHSPSL